MNSIREIARETRRGLFGNSVPARAWETAMKDFQDARGELSRLALELESLDAREHDRLAESIHNQMGLMDATAGGLLATSQVANGLDFIPGFENLNAAKMLGLESIAGSSAIVTLRAMAGSARALQARAHRLLGTSAPQGQLAGFTPWGSIGGDVWEWWNADTVQREYEAVGQVPPSIEEIREGALFDIGKRVEEKVSAFADYSRTILVAGAVIAAVIFLSKK